MLPHDLPQLAVHELLRARASALGDKLAFRFVPHHDGEEQTVTFRVLHDRAMAIAGEVQTLAGQGERALLLYPPGLDFVAAFFGCLYSGIVAVPVAPPTRNRTSLVEAVFRASGPSLVLSTAAHRKLAEQTYTHLPDLLNRPWVATDRVPDERKQQWSPLKADSRRTAFLQYTSGSTASPKGVVLTCENLLHNAALIKDAFGNTSDGSGVSWLPLHHDMGLIGGVVEPVYCGGTCTLLPPAAFLQRPALWLETISRGHATVSGGPDFAYDLCVRKIPAEERKNLDLSSWQVAFTGAERIRAETIERFSAAFAPCGFRREAFFPCYGLAEATLMVSGGPRLTRPTIVHLRADALACHQAEGATDGKSAVRALVACGQCLPGQKIVIVDPRTQLARGDGLVGEIWVQGPSVAGGYFEHPEATAAAFGARLADTDEGPFLRTGDLGFLSDGQLFVTGRLKDVILIRGRNYYPEDIERSVERAHPAFRVGYVAAFSVEVEDQERLVVVQEIDPRRRDLDTATALGAVRLAIADEHELEVHAIVLAKAGEVPKTSSGKTRRSACRDRYLTGELQAVAQWTADRQADDDASVPTLPRPAKATAGEVERWLIERIAGRLGLPPAQVQVTTPFLEFGMGSVDVVEIAAELERWLGRPVSPTAIYNYPNIAALAEWLTRAPARPAASVGPPPPHAPTMDWRPERLRRDVENMTEKELHAFVLQELAKQ
jgi:acyl-CoA synthetase (AMP-forming)/AMP-acid ligase II/acyl carrier protein